MKDHISVFITKEDFETKYYMSNTDCPLAAALKREGYETGYKYGQYAVGGDTVQTGEVRYGILEWEEIITRCNRCNKPEGLMVNLLRI